MPTIKLNAAGKVITKGGKPSCTCCCVCDFYIYAALIFDESSGTISGSLTNAAKFYIVNNSTCDLKVTSFDPSFTSIVPALPPTGYWLIMGNSTLILDVEDSGDIRGLTVTAQTSCGEFQFDIPIGE
jgi:hypothetical protein